MKETGATKQSGLLNQWFAEEQSAHIRGWDFSHIQGRYQEGDGLPWDYERLVRQYLTPDARILDIDRGCSVTVQYQPKTQVGAGCK